MERLRAALALLAIFSLNAGCVRSIATAERVEDPVSAAEAQTFAEFLRTVSRVSAANAQRSQAEREALLRDRPELEGLLGQVATRPADAKAKLQLARAYLEQDLYWNAHELLEDLNSRSPGRWDVLYSLAAVWDGLGDHDLAVEYAEQAVAKRPSADTYELLGRIQLHQRRFSEAATAFLTASELATPDAVVLANAGYAFMSEGRWQEARTYLEQAVLTQPKLVEARNNLAIVLAQLNDYEGALEHLMAVGTDAVAWNNLGSLYLQQGMTQEAHGAFRRSLQLDADYALAAKNLALARSQLPLPVLVDLPPSSPYNDPAADSLDTASAKDGATPGEPDGTVGPGSAGDVIDQAEIVVPVVGPEVPPEGASNAMPEALGSTAAALIDTASEGIDKSGEEPVLSAEDSTRPAPPATGTASEPGQFLTEIVGSNEIGSPPEPPPAGTRPGPPERVESADPPLETAKRAFESDGVSSATSTSAALEGDPQGASRLDETAAEGSPYKMPLFFAAVLIGGIIMRRQRPASRDLTIQARE